MESVGIINAESSDDFVAADKITREQFAVLLSRFVGVKDEEVRPTGSSLFSDVPADHWASGYIDICVQRKILVGTGNGMFGLGESVTYDQAIKSILCAMNYEKLAQAQGGYPEGYFLLAARLGLIDQTGYQKDQPITRGQLSIMLRQALETPVYTVTGITGEAADVTTGTIEENRTPLTEYLDISEKQTGLVNANSLTSLDSENDKAAKGYIKIDNQEFRCGLDDSIDLLGLEVNYYYRNDSDGNTILFAEPTGRNNTIDIVCEDVESIDLHQIKYVVNDKTKTAVFDDLIDIIYNGVACNSVSAGNMPALKPEHGRVRLINHDGDGNIDVLMVTSYDSYYINGYNINEGKLALKKSSGASPIHLDIDEDVFILDSEGKEVGTDEIRSGFVASVLRDINNETVQGLIITNNWVQGIVKEMNHSNGEAFIYDGWYQFDDDLKDDMTLGGYGTFYLDPNDVIIYIDNLQSSGAEDGIYYLVGLTSEGVFNPPTYIMKLLGPDGTIKTYKVDENARFNDQRLGKEIEGTEMVNTLTNFQFKIGRLSQPLRVNISDNVITSIQTFEEEQVVAGRAVYKTTTGFFYSQADVKCYMDSETAVMYVPGADDVNDEARYSIGQYTDFSNDQVIGSGFMAFGVDYENGTRRADLILIVQEDPSAMISNTYSNSGIVTSVAIGLTEDGSDATILQIMKLDGEVVELAVESDDKEFGIGDFVNFSGDFKLAAARVVFTKDEIVNTTEKYQNIADLQDANRYELGAIHRVNGDYITVGGVNATEDQCNVYRFHNTNTKVIVYDSETDKVYLEDKNSLVTAEHSVNPAARTLAYTRACELWCIVVYK